MIFKEIVIGSSSDSDDDTGPTTPHGGYKTASESFECEKVSKLMKELTVEAPEWENFQPELSKRERRKLNKRINNSDHMKVGLTGLAHDERGVIIGTGKDLCDCLSESCAGCWFPCWNCRSTKCGVECRNGRKYIIESVENEADRKITKNPVLPRN